MQQADDVVIDLLREQARWLRLLGLQALRPLLERVLVTDKQKAIYELSDGRRTTREIARDAGVGAGSVSRLWSEWLASGMCAPSPVASGRAQHLSSLSALGIEVPGGAKPAPKESAGEEHDV
jgi:hypothetical protein